MRWWHRLLIRFLPASVVVGLPEDRALLALDRGRRADMLLNDETLIEAFRDIEVRLTNEWRNSASASKEMRETLHHQVAAIQSVRDQLRRWSEDAKFIAAKLEKARR